MSAWIVSEKHIVTLAYFYNKMVKGATGQLNMAEIKQTARILWTENTRSVNCRYGEKVKMHFSKEPVMPDYTMDLVDLTKQIHCWQYQTSETDNHKNTKAWRMMQELKCAILRKLITDNEPFSTQYENSVWGID
jgi:hypothetical protein